MTNTDDASKILKTDALGRVRTPAARREQLLDEFDPCVVMLGVGADGLA